MNVEAFAAQEGKNAQTEQIRQLIADGDFYIQTPVENREAFRKEVETLIETLEYQLSGDAWWAKDEEERKESERRLQIARELQGLLVEAK